MVTLPEVENIQGMKSITKPQLLKAIKLAKSEIKEWQDFLIDCYKQLEKLNKKT